MKHTLAFIAALAMTGAAYAAGPLWLNNYDSGNAIYYLKLGDVLQSGFVTITVNGAEFPGGTAIPVTDGFFDNSFGVTGAPDGSDAAIKLVAWKDDVTKEKGEAIWTQKVGTTPALPAAPVPELLAMPANVTVMGVGPIPSIPEPSMIALALLGGAALLLRRRN